jgi:hypothetical protein
MGIGDCGELYGALGTAGMFFQEGRSEAFTIMKLCYCDGLLTQLASSEHTCILVAEFLT